jgi:hypothetical protein
MYLRGWMCYTRMDVLREKLLHNAQLPNFQVVSSKTVLVLVGTVQVSTNHYLLE